MTRYAAFPPVPADPLWHEGMLLAPQHLQQLALRMERQLGYRMAAADAHGCGIVTLSFDHDALASGLLRIESCQAVMPDGLFVQFPQSDGAALELDLTGHAERLRVSPLRIVLAVPADDPAGGATGMSERFRGVEGAAETDLSVGSGKVRVARRLPNLSLRVEERGTTKFATLPVAEIVLRGEAYTLGDYVPPRLLLPEGAPLALEVSAVARRMREKAVYLSERARSQQGRAGDTAADAMRLPLMALTQALPELEALATSGAAHPFALYAALCRAAGAVAPLAGFAVPPPGRGYRHDDIRASYQPLLRFIDSCLNEVRQEFTVLPFEQSGSSFRFDLSRQRPRTELVVGAQVAPGTAPDRAWAWIEGSLIASADSMETLRRRRILGAPRALLGRDEAVRYSLAGDTVLFRIELDGDFVDPEGVLEVVNTAPELAEATPAQLYAYLAEADAGDEAGDPPQPEER